MTRIGNYGPRSEVVRSIVLVIVSLLLAIGLFIAGAAWRAANTGHFYYLRPNIEGARLWATLS